MVSAEMDTEQRTLTLPDGYAIEPATDREGRRLLVLKRRDGSAVAIFEFSAIGPNPSRIWRMAWEDHEPLSDTI